MGSVWRVELVAKKSVKKRGILRKLGRVMGIVQKSKWMLIWLKN